MRTAHPPLTATVARQRLRNAAFTGPGGAMGAGDRGAYNYVPNDTGNPYDSNDFVYRWRQYVHLYETSWEARKIVRIIPEDALRKDWLAEGIPEQMAKNIFADLQRMQFMNTLKRSLMLERLLGGCLTFMGVDSDTDDTSKEFHPSSGANLRFVNAIPVSRIARMTWENNPLSEHYMRPSMYSINSTEVHVSRCLVWDGEPLFDPQDFALTNFRGNLQGFGPSKLAPVWDDIVKAVGTRQAAYQLIQMNNAILMAVNDLQDLQGTKSGQEALKKVKQIAQQISLYRAALIDGEKVDIKQQSASFGSVPELIITFIQVLAAASDIPATRFLGQAPGGLNATGESDLENYYNVIDAYQRQRIEPQLRRVYDVIGYAKYRDQWKQVREKLTFKFPPLWNASELEEADKNSKNLDNVMKAFEAGLIGEEKVIQEMNTKKIFSITLDKDDISVVEETGLGGNLGQGMPGQGIAQETPNAAAEIQKLRNMAAVPDQMLSLIRQVGGDTTVNLQEFEVGMNVEQEHDDVTRGDLKETAKIVLAHLGEDPTYYSKLARIENASLSPSQKQLLEKMKQHFSRTSEPFFPTSGERATFIALRNLGFFEWKAEEQEWSEKGRASLGRHQWNRKTGMEIWATKLNPIAFNNSLDIPQLPEPTKGRRSAGNYQKHHLRLHGLPFSVENPKGSTRRGTNPDGTEWQSVLPAHYGYIKRTEGADGDHVDAYIGEHEDSELVFVVDQNDLATGGFDEHKVIFGCLSMLQAKELYAAGFSDGKGPQRLGGITPVHVSQFKQWLAEGDTKQPFTSRGE